MVALVSMKGGAVDDGAGEDEGNDEVGESDDGEEDVWNETSSEEDGDTALSSCRMGRLFTTPAV